MQLKGTEKIREKEKSSAYKRRTAILNISSYSEKKIHSFLIRYFKRQLVEQDVTCNI